MPKSSTLMAAVAFGSMVLLGCERQPTQPGDQSVPTPDLPSSSFSQGSRQAPEFEPEDFVAVVDNRFFPLQPGTRYIYTGEEDGEPVRDVMDVTHSSKTILGVKATVVLDRVFQSGALKEKTLDWYAQDERGNVWYLGEDSKEYEDGNVVSTAGSWEAGKNGARAGIIMPAHPRVGQVTQQEFAPGIAEDRARVLRRGVQVSVPYGGFHGCLETEEFTPLEPGVKEVKFYCSQIGFVKARDVQGGTARLALVAVRR
ncbi:MAG: hypothetical protein ACJ8BF_14470 [Gemmatimonadales bacterium]